MPEDCGTGAGGFQPGNTCAKGEGVGDVLADKDDGGKKIDDIAWARNAGKTQEDVRRARFLPDDIAQATDDPRTTVSQAQRYRAFKDTRDAWLEVSKAGKPIPGDAYTVSALAAVVHPDILNALRPPRIHTGTDPILEFAMPLGVLGMTTNATHDLREGRPAAELDAMAADIRKMLPTSSMDDLNVEVGTLSFRWDAGPDVAWHELGHLIDLEFGGEDLPGNERAPAGKALLDWDKAGAARLAAKEGWERALDQTHREFRIAFPHARLPDTAQEALERLQLYTPESAAAAAKIAPSAYALASPQEWYAESVMQYVKDATGRAWLKAHAPNTFEAIDAVLSGRLLKTKAKAKEADPGLAAWLPGGGVEAGEALHAAAVREVWEETGLAVRLTGHLGDFEDDGQTVRYYRAEVLSRGSADYVHQDRDGSGSVRVRAVGSAEASLAGLAAMALVLASA